MTNIFLHTTSIIPLFQKICRIKEPLFCAKDVATALGYSDTADAIQRHCNSGKKVFCPHGNGMEQFQDWVCDEVLPSIRKHGGYLTPDKIEEVLSNPDTIIRLAMQLKNEP